jgi:uncharacterized protein YjbI with pentapeptide repeats
LARRLSWPLLSLIVGGLVLGCVLIFPRLLYPPLTTAELQARGVDDPKEQAQLQDGRLKLQNDARTTLLQALGGLLVLSTAAAGAHTAWQQLQDNRRQQLQNEELSKEQLQLSRDQLRQALESSNEQLRLTREGQVTERFTRAVEQLGSNNIDIVLGGIYALKRIANDSPPDEPAIAEILSAYVRGHAPWPPLGPEQPPEDTPLDELRLLRERRPDVQAALASLDGSSFLVPLDLARTDLRKLLGIGVRLNEVLLNSAHLEGAYLDGADLKGARLDDAHLEHAHLTSAQLGSANLCGAHLGSADLTGADLENADLTNANLEKANLSDAQLKGAHLTGANLKEANLTVANLNKADLAAACLEGAVFLEAHLEGAVLDANLEEAILVEARSDAQTIWPAGFDWQAAGVIMEDPMGPADHD